LISVSISSAILLPSFPQSSFFFLIITLSNGSSARPCSYLLLSSRRSSARCSIGAKQTRTTFRLSSPPGMDSYFILFPFVSRSPRCTLIHKPGSNSLSWFRSRSSIWKLKRNAKKRRRSRSSRPSSARRREPARAARSPASASAQADVPLVLRRAKAPTGHLPLVVATARACSRLSAASSRTRTPSTRSEAIGRVQWLPRGSPRGIHRGQRLMRLQGPRPRRTKISLVRS
jgi:hypothetical protein